MEEQSIEDRGNKHKLLRSDFCELSYIIANRFYKLKDLAVFVAEGEAFDEELVVTLLSLIRASADDFSVSIRKVNYGAANAITVLCLGGFVFTPENLKKYNVSDFQRINIQGADLRGADLSGLDLSYADLRGVSFVGATLDGTNISGSIVTAANFFSERQSIEGHLPGKILDLAFSGDNCHFATVGEDATLRFYDAHKGTQEMCIKKIEGTRIAFVYNNLLGLANTRQVCGWLFNGITSTDIFNYPEKHPMYKIIGISALSDQNIFALAVRYTDKSLRWEWIYMCENLQNNNGRVSVLDRRKVASYKTTDHVKMSTSSWATNHEMQCTCLNLSADGKYLLVGIRGGIVRLWSVTTKNLINEYVQKNTSFFKFLPNNGWVGDPVLCLSMSPNNETIVAGTRNKKVVIWKKGASEDLQLNIKTLDAHAASVVGVAFVAKGEHLISAAKDGCFIIWDVKNWSIIKQINVDQAVKKIALTPNGEFLAWITDTSCDPYIWEARDMYHSSASTRGMIIKHCIGLNEDVKEKLIHQFGAKGDVSISYIPYYLQKEQAYSIGRMFDQIRWETQKQNQELIKVPVDKIKRKKIIGQGGYGRVYECVWHHTDIYDETIAIKFFDVDLRGKYSAFERELNFLKNINSKYIVKVFGVLESPHCGIIMEYCKNGSLYDVLSKTSQGQLKWSVRLQYAVDIAKGITYLHTHEPVIIHNDLKSRNIIVDDNNCAKLCDFGLSSMETGAFPLDKSVFTLLWAAPETLHKKKKSRASDIYSFALILWELASLKRPFFQELDNKVIMKRILRGEVQLFDDETTPNVPDSYKKITQKCWSINPKDRYSSERVLDELKKIKRKMESNRDESSEKISYDDNNNNNNNNDSDDSVGNNTTNTLPSPGHTDFTL